MIHLLLLLVTGVGFGLLCVSRSRHQRDLLGRSLPVGAARYARFAGILALAVAFFLAVDRAGWAVGTLEWLGTASIGALLAMLLLTFRSTRKSSR